MVRVSRLEVYNQLLDTGLLPLVYHGDPAQAVVLVAACAAGGARLIAFTDRGERGFAVVAALARHFAGADPALVFGVGSIADAPSAARCIAAGTRFIVTPTLNPEIARLCTCGSRRRHRHRSNGDSRMNYHAYLSATQGLNTLPFNPCRLLDFGRLTLAADETYRAVADGREILAVLLGGTATFDIDGTRFDQVGGRANVFAGKPHAVYIPAGASFTITATGAVDIALPSAPSDMAAEPYVIAPAQVANGVWGAANFARTYHQILTLAAQPELPARRLIVGETFTPSGNWSTFPPHKHQVDNLPHEAYQEEMYYFRVSPPDGFGLCHYYNEQGEEENFTVRDNSIHMMPYGYHTVVSAPGYTTYYLWFLAGEQRVQAVVDDPQLGKPHDPDVA